MRLKDKRQIWFATNSMHQPYDIYMPATFNYRQPKVPQKCSKFVTDFQIHLNEQGIQLCLVLDYYFYLEDRIMKLREFIEIYFVSVC